MPEPPAIRSGLTPEGVTVHHPDGPPPRVLRTFCAGLVAAALGAGMCLGTLHWFGEGAPAAVFAGMLVGSAVRWGSRDSPGRWCRVWAVLLTYAAVAASHMPGILHELNPGDNAPFRALLAALAAVVLAAAWPVLHGLAGWRGLIGLLMTLLGLYEAWRMNRPKQEHPVVPPQEARG